MREYNTEILSVGTELLLGHITNTDTRGPILVAIPF